MSLQLILGGSGAGKSHYLYNRIIKESIDHPNINYLVIVPEQITMETQKDFITMHENHGIMNIDVLSFMRLAYRIMEEMGLKDTTVLEDTGKNMVLRKVLEEKADSLCYFKSNIRKAGFVDEVKSMLSELYQYSIGEEELTEMIELANHKPLLQAKLKDLLTIYIEFRDFLKDKYITAEEIMDVLYEALEHSNIIKNSVICLDGFTGFTPSQYKVLTRLLKQSNKVYATVTIDKREDLRRVGEEFQLFHLSKKTIKKLEKIAFDNGIDVLDPIFPEKEKGELWRFCENKALSSLEKNLFRYPWEAYNEKQDSIFIDELKNPKDEVRFVVHKIKELVRRKKYRYRDFAVVSGDMESYGRIVLQEFTTAKIPFFLDDKREIKRNPFVILINSMIELLRKQMDYESMFHYLRCGMVPFEKEEIDRLENYCLAYGIRGKKGWNQPFVKGKEVMEEEEIDSLNTIRERVLDSLSLLTPLMERKNHRVREYVERLYDTVIQLNSFEKLTFMEEHFSNEGKLLLAKEYAQVYSKVMELFERMIELLGDEEVTFLEFKDIFNAGIEKAKVGVIPSGIDQVVVGDIERTRLKDIKVLFFIGVNDGVIPKAVAGGGILSDMERELLKEKKVELAPTKREQIYIERLYLYLNLTKPNNAVYLTFCKTDANGKAVKASYLIGKIMQLFPSITLEKAESDWDKLEHMMDEDGGKDCLLEGIRDYKGLEEQKYWKMIYSWYIENDKINQDLTNLINEVYHEEKQDKLSKAVANALYGESLVGSVTRLEQFAACACAHFFSYGLRIRERQEFKLNIPDMGNIFHAALELFSRKLKEQKLTWQTITPEEREQLGDLCVREVTNEYGNTILHSSMRNEYIIERVRRILNRTLWALTKQLSFGEFEPSAYELKFSFMDDLESVRIPLGEEKEMRLSGRIDRVDMCQNKEDIYVKIIDYKSGKKAFSILDLYYGLELQLVVYMETILEKTKKEYPDRNVIPAGVFYYNIDDPIIDKTDSVFYESELLKELRVNGLVNEKTEVIKSLDYSFSEKDEDILKPSIKSTVIPVETIKLGELSKNSSVATDEEFEQIISYARNKMIDFGKEIMEGHCEKNPYKLGDKTACDYCKFGAVCAFDKKHSKDQYRLLERFGKDDVLQKIVSEGELE